MLEGAHTANDHTTLVPAMSNISIVASSPHREGPGDKAISINDCTSARIFQEIQSVEVFKYSSFA